MKSLRVAVVGLGGIARAAHLPVLAARDDVELVAVCDTSPEALARYRPLPGYRNVDDLIAAVDIDAALVLPPEHQHAAAVKPLLSAGVPVLCEKPLAPSVEVAGELRDLATATGTTLMVGFNRRFAPVYVEARAALQRHPASVGTFEKTRLERGYRGSVENLIHMVDLARFFFGECVDVTARAVFDDPYREDSLAALLTFEGGQLATVVGNRSTGVWTERVAFHGSGQRVTVAAPDMITTAAAGEERTRRQSTTASGFSTPIHTLGFAAQADHFFTAVRSGAPVSENDATSALRTQQLMTRMLRSAGLPTEDERVPV